MPHNYLLKENKTNKLNKSNFHKFYSKIYNSKSREPKHNIKKIESLLVINIELKINMGDCGLKESKCKKTPAYFNKYAVVNYSTIPIP